MNNINIGSTYYSNIKRNLFIWTGFSWAEALINKTSQPTDENLICSTDLFEPLEDILVDEFFEENDGPMNKPEAVKLKRNTRRGI